MKGIDKKIKDVSKKVAKQTKKYNPLFDQMKDNNVQDDKFINAANKTCGVYKDANNQLVDTMTKNLNSDNGRAALDAILKINQEERWRDRGVLLDSQNPQVNDGARSVYELAYAFSDNRDLAIAIAALQKTKDVEKAMEEIAAINHKKPSIDNNLIFAYTILTADGVEITGKELLEGTTVKLLVRDYSFKEFQEAVQPSQEQ